MEYTIEQFKKDVVSEAENIHHFATKDELDRLHYDSFDPNSPRKCIYGLLTGSCISPRGIQLIKTCCPIYFENRPGPLCRKSIDTIEIDEVFSRAGESVEIDSRANGYIERLSAIEIYILTPGAKHRELISFIKGDISEFEP